MDWHDKLAEARIKLPPKVTLTAKRRHPTRKEVVAGIRVEYTRISAQIVRKRIKKVTI